MDPYLIPLIILIIIYIVLICRVINAGIRVVHQGTFVIVERFGQYFRTLKPGIHFLIPFVDTTRYVHWKFIDSSGGKTRVKCISTDRIDMREHVLDFNKQTVITKDNVIMEIDALAYFRITDPKSATFNIQNLPDAIELLVQATLRNIIAKITLDDTFSSREAINEELLDKIHLDAERWGVTVTRVEIQNIDPPKDLKRVMENQIKSERSRRSEVLRADGDRMHDVIISRGNVATQVLNAEGQRTSMILRAQGDAKAKLMAAEAEKQSLEIVAKALEGSGVLVTDYMVAQQYLTVLRTLFAQNSNAQVTLLPTKTIKSIQQIVEANC